MSGIAMVSMLHGNSSQLSMISYLSNSGLLVNNVISNKKTENSCLAILKLVKVYKFANLITFLKFVKIQTYDLLLSKLKTHYFNTAIYNISSVSCTI